jgi:hypothetical protein
MLTWGKIMESSSFIGTVCSEPSGEKQIEDWLKEILKQADEERRKNGQPRYIITGIDYGFAYKPRRKSVVIGH